MTTRRKWRGIFRECQRISGMSLSLGGWVNATGGKTTGNETSTGADQFQRARGESVFALEPFADLKQPENTPEVGV